MTRREMNHTRNSEATPPPPLPAPLFRRILAAAFLQRAVYDEVADDRYATGQAAAVICLAAIAQRSVLISYLTQAIGAWALLVAMIFGLLRWLIFTTVAYSIGRLVVGRECSYRRLLRCLGFAGAPGILNALAFLVGHDVLIRLLVALWLIAATVVGVRSALRIGLGRAIAVGSLAFLVDFLLHVLLDIASGSL